MEGAPEVNGQQNNIPKLTPRAQRWLDSRQRAPEAAHPCEVEISPDDLSKPA